MIQNIIVILILIGTVVYIVYKTIQGLTAKKTEGCAGCSGCELKNSLKGAACAPVLHNKPRSHSFQRIVKH